MPVQGKPVIFLERRTPLEQKPVALVSMKGEMPRPLWGFTMGRTVLQHP